jgi:riboflavin synthase
VVDTAAHSFSVSIIPHTLDETALQHKHAGDIVNIECDVIGKYVDHLLHFKRPEASQAGSKVTTSFLMENGFL